MANCPNCTKPMAPGWLGSESFIGGAKWYQERNTLALGGEPLVKPDLLGMVYIEGFRCKACNTLLLRY